MDIEIAEVSATKDGAIYVVASYWWDESSGGPPDLVNDFVMPALQPTLTRIVTDERGWPVTTRGQAIDPATITENSRHEWQRETVDGDVRGQIMANVMRFGERAQSRMGDLRSPSIKRVQTDPQGLLERDDVKSLRPDARASE